LDATQVEPRRNRLARAAVALVLLAATSCAHMPWRKKGDAEVRLGDSGLTVNRLRSFASPTTT
jgi:hypothetical protein